MNLGRHILCRFGFHLRSRGRARPTATGLRSRCSRCSIPMRRTDGGRWQVDTMKASAEREAAIPKRWRAIETGEREATKPRRRIGLRLKPRFLGRRKPAIEESADEET